MFAYLVKKYLYFNLNISPLLADEVLILVPLVCDMDTDGHKLGLDGYKYSGLP